jgi:1-acyl-sn-glycerol-3-phosphate acyltransferase
MARIVGPLYWFGHFLFRVLFRLLGKWEVGGLENVPATGGAVIAPNHCSYLDPPVAGCGLRRPTYFMGKKELFRVPVLGFLIRRTGCFPVDRDKQDREAIRFALEILRAGSLLTLFPEGTRSPDGTLQPASGVGAALIASRAGVPIIPAYIRGTRKAYGPGAKWVHRADISLTYGAPIPTVQADGQRARKDELTDLTQRVMAAIAELGAEPPAQGAKV